jgi:glycosyltransferase involved in cell wall biosynthesis
MIRTIALVDWHWVGHHPTFFSHFIRAFNEMGIHVVALCPEPSQAMALAGETRAPANTHYLKVAVPVQRFRSLRPRRISSIDWAIRHFKGIENLIFAWQRESGRKVDAVFHACVYDRDFEWISHATPFLRLPWTGLYLHAMSYRMPGTPHPLTRRIPKPRGMFGNRLCRAIAVLDEGIVDRMADDIGKPVVALPDIADGRTSANPDEKQLGDELKRYAAGKPVVGLFGHLQKSKGLTSFLEAARLPEASGLCFALCGQMSWPADDAEARQVRQLMGGCPNLWTHLERIPTEAALNHAMAACDVLAAAYVDFPHSSGIQAKAASLGRPIIVSAGHLMAERAERFRMGAVVRQNDPHDLLRAVLEITSDAAGWADRTQPLWDEYLSGHSFEKFRHQLAKLLASL